ncbi:solute carrier organic anion transporter family member 4A1-like [Culicoides brevitarsis]|uniref:solute carrier organic anion transporter family member 4A1-like n=1 Tax=Culicoides brevitarsis TaxID=469753 RepID=UPI00307C74D1
MSRLATLFRSNSDADVIQDSRFEARSNNIPKGDLDCGIVSLGWCNSLACQRLGNSNTFLAVFCVAGLLQGAVTSYFRISAKQMALQYDFDPNLIDWLLVVSGLTQGMFAILVAYWGHRIHRISWLGGILMLQACLIVMRIIPTLVKKDTGPIETTKVTDLCFEYVAGRLGSARSHAITTQIMLFIVQFGIGMGNVAFYCLGISYLDDNLKEHESPAYIAGALAAYL